MSGENEKGPGKIGWVDLTVADADRVRDFYSRVVGWKAEPLDMGGYSDYAMSASDSKATVAGICHARGPNAEIPPCWMIYITVTDLDASLTEVERGGGKRRSAVRDCGGHGRFCMIEDPAGAVAMLFEAAKGESTPSK
jgi:hypothetical protein